MSSIAGKISETVRAYKLLTDALVDEGVPVGPGEAIEPDNVLFVASELVSRQSLEAIANALNSMQGMIGDLIQLAADQESEDGGMKLRALRARREADEEG